MPKTMTGIMNLPGLHELDLKELEFEFHVKAGPAAISRMCPHCGEIHRVQKHGSRSMFIRDLPKHGLCNATQLLRSTGSIAV